MDGDIKARSEKAKSERVYEWKNAGDYSHAASRRIYTCFANDAIDRLWRTSPDLDFLFSLSHHDAVDWRVTAPTKIAAIDMHVWFQHHLQALLIDSATAAGYGQATHNLAPTT
jgi:hypothetical protein